MYQSVDDNAAETNPEARTAVPLIAWCGAALLLALFIGGVLYTNSNRNKADTIKDPKLSEARTAYHAALSENQPALRRARLIDFQNAYPSSDRTPLVQTQLDILNVKESEDWNAVLNMFYNPRASADEKSMAIMAYTAIWSGDILGGRGEDIQKLEKQLEAAGDTLDKPDRSLKERTSPIPTNIHGDTLLGKPRQVVTYVPPPAPKVEPQDPVKLDIVQPKVRKDVTPKYPGRAWRKRIPAIVTLKVDIDETGQVISTELVSIKAERYEKNFIKVSERAALKTRYFPKVVNGKPVPAQGIIKRYRFEPAPR